MRPWYVRAWRWMQGDWWDVTYHCGKWGVYHPFRSHFWGHPYSTKQEAQDVCAERNGRQPTKP